MEYNFYGVLDNLIRLTITAREAAAKDAKTLSPEQWLHEFCTVRIGGARGIGHTTGVAQLACDMSNGDVVALFKNKAIKRIATDFIEQKCGGIAKNPHVKLHCMEDGYSEFLTMVRSPNNKTIIFDVGSTLNDMTMINHCLHHFAGRIKPGEDVLLILVG